MPGQGIHILARHARARTHTHTKHRQTYRATDRKANPLQSVLQAYFIPLTIRDGTIIRFLLAVSVNETRSSGCVTFFRQRDI